MNTLADFAQPQLEQARHICADAVERGFMVLPNMHGRAPCWRLVDVLVRDWEAGARGRKMLIVYQNNHLVSLRGDYWFSVRIPDRKRFWPITVSLNMFSQKETSRRGSTEGQGLLIKTMLRVEHEYKGKGPDALKVLLSVLSMPQHREILTGKGGQGAQL